MKIPFYPAAGRLGRDDNGRLEIVCNNEEALFIEAERDSEIDDLSDFMLNLEIPRLIPSVDYLQGISSFPLFVIQITTFKYGGVSMGIRFHHTTSDGLAALHFINTWRDVAQGIPITIPPFIDRTILQNCIEIFKITPQHLQTLKNKVKNIHGKAKYTSYQILIAHIWRCTSKTRDLPNVVNTRSKLHPPTPLGYFGNITTLATSIALSSEVLSESLEDTAERIDKKIMRIDNECLRSAIDYLELLNDLKPIMRGAHACRCPNHSIVSWMRLPFYDADTGMRKPIFVRPANPLEGKGYTYCQADHMQAFQNLSYEF
uniref:Uncharacterized protein n=1 Tax=Manihot esculenta TaxID=3983 RepID=A0A2C9VMP1_MANES